MVKVSGYKPTQEQIDAAKARREAQQAEKMARKTKAGGKTVKINGEYKPVNVTSKHVAAKQAEREAAAAAKKNHFGGRTIFDKKSGKYISQTAEETKALKEVTKKGVKIKKPGLFSKVGKFFKGMGKAGLIIGALSALVAGGVYLYNKITGKKETAPAEDIKETPAVPAAPGEEEEKEKVEEPDKTDPVPTTPEEKEEPEKEIPKEYVVQKGDNVWNIAKQHLKDMNADPDYKPTDAEILKHTKELMELNKLEFEPDGYHVMIRPKDKLKLAA